MRDPLFSLDGKRVLLTGAGGAIGGVLASAMAARGAVVGLQDISPDKLEPLRQRIADEGGSAVSIVADLAEAESARAMVRDAAQTLGGIDVLVNGAGINRRKPIDDVTPDDFDAIVAVNMRAVYFASQAAHPIMAARGGGAIVNLSSLSARYSFNTISVYAATKAAVSSMTRSFAREWVRDGIRVNCIEPSVVKTEFTKPLWGEGHRQRWFDETTPIGRLSVPDELVGSVIFLATDASAYITGQSLVIDGGILSGADWDSYSDLDG
jgi:NAD(P)-dependent dehydrogenase (short-subunit alcohol dehydrogenase family)